MKKASGHVTKVLRAPYGAFGKKQWQETSDLIDMNVLWDIDTLDWKRPGAKAIHDAVMTGAHKRGDRADARRRRRPFAGRRGASRHHRRSQEAGYEFVTTSS